MIGISYSLQTLMDMWRPGRETGEDTSCLTTSYFLTRQWRKNKNPADSLECGAKRAPAFGSGVDLNRFGLNLERKTVVIKFIMQKFWL